MTGKPPWETILLNGNVLAPDGKKMSKSLGNIISPSELQRDYPTDAIRQWAALSGAMAKDRPFSYEDIKYAKSFLIKFWNAARFIEGATKDYANDANGTNADGSGGADVNAIIPFGSLHSIDKWMFSRMNQVIRDFTSAMEKYEYHTAMSGFLNFFWHEVCDNYLEYVKHRIYDISPEGAQAKRSAQFVLRYVLLNSIKLIAPVLSHISEELYHSFFNANEKESIHLSKWPEPKEIDEAIIKRMEPLHRIISELRQYKAKNKMAQNAQIPSITISLEEGLSPDLLDEIRKIGKVGSIETKPAEKGKFCIECG